MGKQPPTPTTMPFIWPPGDGAHFEETVAKRGAVSKSIYAIHVIVVHDSASLKVAFSDFQLIQINGTNVRVDVAACSK